MSTFLIISVTGPKVAQRIQVVSILLHEAKPVLGLFCLHSTITGSSGHVTSRLQYAEAIGWGLRVCTQGLGSGLMVKV